MHCAAHFIASLLAFILCTNSVISEETKCPFRWTKSVVEGKCIQVFSFKRHFEQARDWCQMFQTGETALADLLSIHSEEESRQIHDLATSLNGKSSLWIGMQMDGGQNPQWVDGSPTSYQNFDQGEASAMKVCVTMDVLGTSTGSPKWSKTVDCLEEEFFACEMFLGTPISTTSTTTTTTTTTTTSPFPPQKSCRGYLGQDSGVKRIELPSGEIAETFCNIGDKNAFTVIQNRGEEDVVSFDRTIQEYEKQIGLPGKHTNFWLGLENIRLLIGENFEYGMAIELCCNENPGPTTFYSNLKLLDKSNGYVLMGDSLDTIGLNFPNFFTDLNSSFSTYDSFHIGVPVGMCDVINNKELFDGVIVNGPGGWWFGSCANNLNGHYYESGSSYFEDASKCLVDKSKMGDFGSGVEFRTNMKVSDSEVFDAVSWTRARMSIYEVRYGLPRNAEPLCH